MPSTEAAELAHLRFVVANLRDELTRTKAELQRVTHADWVVFDLWSREVQPGWRMWRIKRRREAVQ